MFGLRTCEASDIVTRTYESWDSYMGHVWHDLLTFCNLQDESTVVEFACGNSTKLGIALQKSHFKGQFYLIDPSIAALKELTKKYQVLLPHATIHPLDCTLNKALKDLPSHPDFVIGNHALDDMILSSAFEGEYSDLFQWSLSANENISSEFEKNWALLEKDTIRLTAIKQEISSDLIKAITELKPKCFMMNQYASYVLKKHKLNAINLHAKDIMIDFKKHYANHLLAKETVQALLNAHKNYNNQQIGTEVLNAENWCVFQDHYET